MLTDDNDAYADLDKQYAQVIDRQFLSIWQAVSKTEERGRPLHKWRMK